MICKWIFLDRLQCTIQRERIHLFALYVTSKMFLQARIYQWVIKSTVQFALLKRGTIFLHYLGCIRCIRRSQGSVNRFTNRCEASQNTLKPLAVSLVVSLLPYASWVAKRQSSVITCPHAATYPPSQLLRARQSMSLLCVRHYCCLTVLETHSAWSTQCLFYRLERPGASVLSCRFFGRRD